MPGVKSNAMVLVRTTIYTMVLVRTTIYTVYTHFLQKIEWGP